MAAWIDQPETPAESAQPCGCDMGCKPEPHYCEQHRADNVSGIEPGPSWWRNQKPTGVQVMTPEHVKAMQDAFNNCHRGTSAELNPNVFPQDGSAVSSVLGDTCPRCGGQLDFDEVDIGVGVMRGNPGCPNCHWVPAPVVVSETCPRCGTPGDQDDCQECHPTRPR